MKNLFINCYLPIIKLTIYNYCNFTGCLGLFWFWFSGIKCKRIGHLHRTHTHVPLLTFYFFHNWLLKQGNWVILWPPQYILYNQRTVCYFFYTDYFTLFFRLLPLFMTALNINFIYIFYTSIKLVTFIELFALSPTPLGWCSKS